MPFLTFGDNRGLAGSHLPFMDEIIQQLATDIALLVEAAAAVLIAYGAAEALFHALSHLLHRKSAVGWRKELFVRFGIWLLLGLQFALAADILRSLVAPTWNEIGQLAAIAAIRTFLNYFLERDIGEAAASGERELTHHP
jgi:uncharacterized membrane protein